MKRKNLKMKEKTGGKMIRAKGKRKTTKGALIKGMTKKLPSEILGNPALNEGLS
jgi:hypothetical protein